MTRSSTPYRFAPARSEMLAAWSAKTVANQVLALLSSGGPAHTGPPASRTAAFDQVIGYAAGSPINVVNPKVFDVLKDQGTS